MPGPDPLAVAAQRGRVRLEAGDAILLDATRRAMREYLDLVRATTLGGDTTLVAAPINEDAWPPISAWRAIVQRILVPAFRRVWTSAWFTLHRDVPTSHPEPDDDEPAYPTATDLDAYERSLEETLFSTEEHLQQHLDDFTDRLTGATWPADVYTAVRREVVDWHDAREHPDELRGRIAGVLDLDRWDPRAETIARNESAAAYAGGQYAAAHTRREQLGEELVKQWIATDDVRTRRTHREASGELAPLDGTFAVGGEQLRFPHDPLGGPAETINCRCVLNWLTTDEADHAQDLLERSQRTGPPPPLPAHLAAASPDPATGEGDPVPDEPNTSWLTAAAGRMPAALRRFWAHGKGALKIMWGKKGDFDRCRAALRPHVPPGIDLEGLCSNLHVEALGVRPGKEHAASAGDCPCDGLTNEELEALFGAALAIIDEEETVDPTSPEATTTVTTTTTNPPTTPETATDVADAQWQIPADDEVTDEDLLVDGVPIAPDEIDAADRTPGGNVTTEKRQRAESSGAAMKGGRFPIENGSDLDNAIDSYGLAGGKNANAKGRAAVKAHIVRRAKALNLTAKLPDTWKKSSGQLAAAAQPTAVGGQSTTWARTVASATPAAPPAEWFADPQLTGPTKLRVTDDGRVYGHIADWSARHAVYDVPPPRDPYGGLYPKFHRHPITTADGGIVKTGPIATGTHGDTGSLDILSVMRHYDDPNFVAADVVVGEDEHGIWASGALRNGVSPEQVDFLARYDQSGHWLYDELLASCCVSVPAYWLPDDDAVVALAAAPREPGQHRVDVPKQRSVLDKTGHVLALVAAGIVTQPPTSTPQVDGWSLYRDFKAAEATDKAVTAARRRIHAPVVAAAAARITERRS